MILECIDNRDVEKFITVGKQYKVMTKYERGYGVMCDNDHEFPFHVDRFKVISEDVEPVEEPKGITNPVIEEEPLERKLERKKPKRNNLMSQVFGGV